MTELFLLFGQQQSVGHNSKSRLFAFKNFIINNNTPVSLQTGSSPANMLFPRIEGFLAPVVPELLKTDTRKVYPLHIFTNLWLSRTVEFIKIKEDDKDSMNLVNSFISKNNKTLRCRDIDDT